MPILQGIFPSKRTLFNMLRFSMHLIFKAIFLIYGLTTAFIILNIHTSKVTESNWKKDISVQWNAPWGERFLYKMKRYIGPGENGTNIIIPHGLNNSKVNTFPGNRHGFNLYVSDFIGLHRTNGDWRPTECVDKEYPVNLPPVSVVIIFRDEYPSIVLRTAYSVLDTTPDHLIKEIVLVDDGSIDEDLKTVVDMHVANVNKFKLLTNKEPLGLMMARQRGIAATSTDYFVVMDGHMEVSHGWLEPIIYRLLQEPRALVSPKVGDLNPNTFGLSFADYHKLFMYFSQISMEQVWVPFDKSFVKIRNGSIEPLIYPVLQGMVMAMRKDVFFQLGGFDPGMNIWGSEQIELSVKVWLCGGRVEIIPCSRAVHMFRNTPWAKNRSQQATNKARFAEAWLEGEQRDIVLDMQYKLGANVTGDIVARKAIKVYNKCKSYSYFLKQVKLLANIYVANNTMVAGQIFNNLTGFCIDNTLSKDLNNGHIGIYKCNNGNTQYFLLTDKFQIRVDRYIIYVKKNDTAILSWRTVLEWDDPSTYFKYNGDGTISHVERGQCVTIVNTTVILQSCIGSTNQLFEWRRLEKKHG